MGLFCQREKTSGIRVCWDCSLTHTTIQLTGSAWSLANITLFELVFRLHCTIVLSRYSKQSLNKQPQSPSPFSGRYTALACVSTTVILETLDAVLCTTTTTA